MTMNAELAAFPSISDGHPNPDGSRSMPVVRDDGGRFAAGFKGSASDCVCRSIAIATGRPYATVYDDLSAFAKRERPRAKKRSSPRTGVHKPTIDRYLSSLGWHWQTTMQIGSGCQVHLCHGELPTGRLIVRSSKHLTAVIDGVIHDTHDPQRLSFIDVPGGRRVAHRCAYGYWHRPTT